MCRKFVETNGIFGIYIPELPLIPIFKAFALFLAEILAFTYLCHFLAEVNTYINYHLVLQLII